MVSESEKIKKEAKVEETHSTYSRITECQKLSISVLNQISIISNNKLYLINLNKCGAKSFSKFFLKK